MDTNQDATATSATSAQPISSRSCLKVLADSVQYIPFLASGVGGWRLQPGCCDNINMVGIPCENKGTFSCEVCRLVKYCSETCQIVDSEHHRFYCPSKFNSVTWDPDSRSALKEPSVAEETSTADAAIASTDRDMNTSEEVIADTSDGLSTLEKPLSEKEEKKRIAKEMRKTLTFEKDSTRKEMANVRRYLWGNVSAYDVLNLDNVEGADWKEDLNILFAASGDLRNVVKTVNTLPEAFQGQCNVTINDCDIFVVCRSIIILLLSMLFQHYDASDIIVHLWYSARLTWDMYMKAIQERVVPEIRQALKDALAQHVPEDKILSKTFTNGTSTLTVHLSPEAWLQILDILQPSRNPTEMCWRWRAKTLKWESSSRKLERLLYCIDPRYRAGNVHYRETGVLLPYGAKCGHFDVFNPTLFHNFGNCLVNATPLHGASVADLKDCQKSLGLPEYDLYGGFFYQRKQMINQFRNALSTRKVNFEIFHDDATALARDFEGRQKGDEGTFDRIDLSNTVDYMYLGIKKSLETFIPLLKSKALNPNATLLAYFMKASEQLSTVPSYLKDVEEKLYETLLQEEWLKQGPAAEMFYHAKRKQIQYILWNPEESFDSYCAKYNFDAAAEESKACTRNKPVIGPAWPMRHDFKDVAKLAEDVQISLGPFSWADGNIRFAEWHRL